MFTVFFLTRVPSPSAFPGLGSSHHDIWYQETQRCVYEPNMYPTSVSPTTSPVVEGLKNEAVGVGYGACMVVRKVSTGLEKSNFTSLVLTAEVRSCQVEDPIPLNF